MGSPSAGPAKDLGPPDPPRDLNVQRYQNDRAPVHTPYVKVDQLNNTIRMDFTRGITMNVSTGTKDRGYQNMERVRLLNSRPRSELRVAPDEHRRAGAPVLLHDSQGHVTQQGQGKPMLDYAPLDDAIAEPNDARARRGIVGDGQKHVRTVTVSSECTSVSLELGYLSMPAGTPDGSVKTYWRHRVTLAYPAATDRRLKDNVAAKPADMATDL